MNGLRAYASTQQTTASKERLMVMLFNAALAHIRTGAEMLERGQKMVATRPLFRAGDIVRHLRTSLDPSRDLELCRRLTDVYTFVEARLIVAYSSGDAGAARDAERVFAPVAAAFAQAVASMDARRPGEPA